MSSGKIPFDKNKRKKFLTVSRKSDIIILEKKREEKLPKKFFQKNPKKVLTDSKKSDIIKTTKKQGRQELPKLTKKGCDQTQERGLS